MQKDVFQKVWTPLFVIVRRRQDGFFSFSLLFYFNRTRLIEFFFGSLLGSRNTISPCLFSALRVTKMVTLTERFDPSLHVAENVFVSRDY